MTHRWQVVTRDSDKKAHIDLNHGSWDIKSRTLPNLPFTRSRKTKDVEIVAAEIQRKDFVLVRKCRQDVDRLCRGRVNRDVQKC